MRMLLMGPFVEFNVSDWLVLFKSFWLVSFVRGHHPYSYRNTAGSSLAVFVLLCFTACVNKKKDHLVEAILQFSMLISFLLIVTDYWIHKFHVVNVLNVSAFVFIVSFSFGFLFDVHGIYIILDVQRILSCLRCTLSFSVFGVHRFYNVFYVHTNYPVLCT